MGDRETRDLLKKLDRTPKKDNRIEARDLEVALNASLNLDENKNATTHPVFKQISLINGQINKMDTNGLKKRCKDLNINNAGKREAIKRRLKEYYKAQMLIKAGLMEERESKYGKNPDYFVVIDFEATCEERNPSGYPHEIIEFPAVLVDAANAEVADVFHSYVRPVINPRLSEFCKNLTGIDQATVDRSPTFPEVNDRFVDWLKDRDLGTKFTFTAVTDGPFDMGRFLWLQCRHSDVRFPTFYAAHWANIRKTFSNFYKTSGSQNEPKLPSLQGMLDSLGLEFEGSPHSGLDDAKNIARILVRLLEDRAIVRVNEKITNVSEESENRGPAKLNNVASVNRKEAEAISKKKAKS